MHNLRSTNILDYTSDHYNGPALQMGAGVQGFEAYDAANAKGLRVVGGDCSTVGMAGGYTSGGGHSSLSSTYGLAADQTLELEVVTANGSHITASPSHNSDLYWALSGGGPGTFAVVLSVIVRAHPDGVVGGARLSFNSSNMSNDTYWSLFASWQEGLPAIVDTGATAAYAITQEQFFVQPITAPGKSSAEVSALLEPFLTRLRQYNITYQLNVTSFPTFLEHFNNYLGPLPYGSYTVDQLFGGRLIPRSIVENNNEALVAAMRNITENTSVFMGFVSVNVAQPISPSSSSLQNGSSISNKTSNAVLPAWREAVISVLVQSTWDFNLTRQQMASRDKEITDIAVPALTALTPGSGTYLNEADFNLKTWKEDFYGANYPKLAAIKSKYDPQSLFYATTAVGSDGWTVAEDGRMCLA